MYMTAREQAMQFAQQQGYNAFPYGVLPAIYRGDSAKHLKDAWNAGYNQAKQERYL
jgi:hypothetical protein